MVVNTIERDLSKSPISFELGEMQAQKVKEARAEMSEELSELFAYLDGFNKALSEAVNRSKLKADHDNVIPPIKENIRLHGFDSDLRPKLIDAIDSYPLEAFSSEQAKILKDIMKVMIDKENIIVLEPNSKDVDSQSFTAMVQFFAKSTGKNIKVISPAKTPSNLAKLTPGIERIELNKIDTDKQLEDIKKSTNPHNTLFIAGDSADSGMLEVRGAFDKVAGFLEDMRNLKVPIIKLDHHTHPRDNVNT